MTGNSTHDLFKPAKVNIRAYIIADQAGRAQLHTLRSNRASAWTALLCKRLTAKDRRGLQRNGFRCEYVVVESHLKLLR